MQKTLILYESRYGSTESVAKNIALILGPAKYCKIDDFKESYKEFECFVIGTPIYDGKIDEKVSKFIINNSNWLRNKIIAFFCTCISIKNEGIYMKQLTQMLGKDVMHFQALGGSVELAKLSRTDYNSVKALYASIKIPLIDVDMSNINSVINFALEVKNIKEEFVRRVPEVQLLKTIEEFIIRHNTCTLSTACGKRVRGTPIEYKYKSGYFYFFTEGGEKFSNVLLNNSVSISIYENFESMMRLSGMQILGTVTTVDHDNKEYNDILNIGGIKPEQIKNFEIMINILKVRIDKVEFLYSKFKNMGYDVKQVYKFK